MEDILIWCLKQVLACCGTQYRVNAEISISGKPIDFLCAYTQVLWYLLLYGLPCSHPLLEGKQKILLEIDCVSLLNA